MTGERPMGETRTRMVRLMMPTDANPSGNVHGGAIMKYVDEVAGIVAHRHCRRNVVTARMERMDFHEAVFVGNVLTLDAILAHTGRTSMDVVVHITAEDMDTAEVVHTGTAWLTMVALNERHRPVPVPRVVPATEEEKRLYEEARNRREARKKEEKGR
ncbi:MAG TPA: acyl-CoA thioesterase [Candidatus Thermoplasmatota archaeon]|nr:acyl-CoA thioesterase [Candidatus Thermoplasmatota archaeon]